MNDHNQDSMRALVLLVYICSQCSSVMLGGAMDMLAFRSETSNHHLQSTSRRPHDIRTYGSMVETKTRRSATSM